jgi:quinoprotein glucose dehydrogenase
LRPTIQFMLVLATCAVAARAAEEPGDWPYYGGDEFGQRFSPLDQITRENVGELEVAWTYRSGELGAGFAKRDSLAFEATPIHILNTLYLSTPTNIVIALDAATGRERWRFDPRIDRAVRYREATSRGVSYWSANGTHGTEQCSERIFEGTLDARLIALDAHTGRPCADFGRNGAVDLRAGQRMPDASAYLVTSPPAIYHEFVIVGLVIGDNRAVDVERGVVRAYDARTGALRWIWDPIPTTSSDPVYVQLNGGSAARTGAANAWSIMSIDPARGLVFVPTGSVSPDFYGGERLGSNAHANSLVALNAATGALVWHQQLVHHDLWDYDVAAQPVLIELERSSGVVSAVLQATKTGLLFVFDRENGTPVLGLRERPAPRGGVPGEQPWPTQPFPIAPAPLVSHEAITPDDAWGLTFYDRGKCRDLIARLDSQGIYTPPSTKGTIISPGYTGGIDWGGVAFDADRQVAVAAVNHLPMVVTLMPPDKVRAQALSGDFPQSNFANQSGTPYGVRRETLLSPWGLPCTKPPWGTLAAVDLRTARTLWEVPLGSTEDLAPFFVPTRTLGTLTMGGPIMTAGGLIFVGAAMDDYLRAFNVETGRELWKGRLPAGGQATPMTYRAGPHGRQFIVIAAGGHGNLGTRQGDYVVAFALPVKGK